MERERKKKEEQQNPEYILKKEQDLAIKSRIPLALTRTKQVVDFTNATNPGGLEPYRFTLGDKAKEVLTSEMKVFFEKFTEAALKNKNWSKMERASAKFVNAEQEQLEMGDHLLTNLKDFVPAGFFLAGNDAGDEAT